MNLRKHVTEDRLRRGLVGVLFALGLSLSSNISSIATEDRVGNSVYGLILAAIIASVWGARTRPKANVPWVLIGIVGVVGLIVIGQTVLAMSLLVGIFLVHDMQLTPSLILTAGTIAALWQPGLEWFATGEETAWWIAWTLVFTTAAAIVERDRLSTKAGRSTHPAWTAFRAAFVGLWTITILSFREDIELGQLFASFGVDISEFSGQMLLVAILLGALVAAIFLFRNRKPKPNPTQPAT
jgi:hypothetical protein